MYLFIFTPAKERATDKETRRRKTKRMYLSKKLCVPRGREAAAAAAALAVTEGEQKEL